MSKLFKAIGHFIDKKIVLPIAKFFTGISKKFKGNGRNFEKMLTMKPGMIIVSLLWKTILRVSYKKYILKIKIVWLLYTINTNINNTDKYKEW